MNIRIIFPYANLPLKDVTPKSCSPHCVLYINNKYYRQLVDAIFDFITRPIFSGPLDKIT